VIHGPAASSFLGPFQSCNQLGFGGDSNGTDYQFGQGMLNAWTNAEPRHFAATRSRAGWRLPQQGSRYKPEANDCTISAPCSCS
jgi:hypothetical protein